MRPLHQPCAAAPPPRWVDVTTAQVVLDLPRENCSLDDPYMFFLLQNRPVVRDAMRQSFLMRVAYLDKLVSILDPTVRDMAGCGRREGASGGGRGVPSAQPAPFVFAHCRCDGCPLPHSFHALLCVCRFTSQPLASW
jgi:hypothetical protein